MLEINDGVLTWYEGDEENVVIPDGVTKINARAFFYNPNLKSLTIPTTVTAVSSEAFRGCVDVRVTDLNAWLRVNEKPDAYRLFVNGAELKELVLDDGLEELPDYTLGGCNSVERVFLPNGVKKIGDFAFYNCSSLKKINFPTGITHIGRHAFSLCKGLEKLDLPESLTHIGDSAFTYCSAVKSITIPNAVTHIGLYAFGDCQGVKKVTLPNGVTQISEKTFYDCKSLTEIVIPQSVTAVGKDAFANCEALKSVTLEGDIRKIHWQSFANCPALTQIKATGYYADAVKTLIEASKTAPSYMPCRIFCNLFKSYKGCYLCDKKYYRLRLPQESDTEKKVCLSQLYLCYDPAHTIIDFPCRTIAIPDDVELEEIPLYVANNLDKVTLSQDDPPQNIFDL